MQVLIPRAAQAALLGAAVLLSAACSTTKPVVAAAPTPAASSAPAAVAPAARPMAVTESDAQRIERIVRQLAANSIYFDYNTYTIKPEYQRMLEQDFAALKTMPQVNLRLEGNADERGSREYNLALGQKRAEAVRHALALLGVPDSRMEAVSYGKEKPRATCHEEKCWAEDRRADVAVKRP